MQSHSLGRHQSPTARATPGTVVSRRLTTVSFVRRESMLMPIFARTVNQTPTMTNLVWTTLANASIAQAQRPLRELLDKQAATAASVTPAMKPAQEQRVIPANALRALLAHTRPTQTQVRVSPVEPENPLTVPNRRLHQHARTVFREHSPLLIAASVKSVQTANGKLIPAAVPALRAPATLDMPPLE